MNFLRLSSFLDPEDIDLDLVLSAHELLPPHLRSIAGKPLAIERAVGALIRTGLATRIDDQHVRIHRLVAEVTRLHLTPDGSTNGEDARTWALRAAAVVNHLFPQAPQDPANWQRCAYLAAHASTAVEHAEYYNALEAEAEALLARLSAYLQSQVVGNLDVFTTSPAVDDRRDQLRSRVRSAYGEQIRRIAPSQLVAREQELTELADFCTRPGDRSYFWLQAPAWSGKSALLAWFVQFPPPSVDVVAFFITGRLAGQSDRIGFTTEVLDQLTDLLTEPIPTSLPEAALEGFLLDMLARAARQCEQRGRRLVLVVDGLDEDRGVTTGPHAHSIAGLLPADPPDGMRVIVAGRPNPPVPDDVPDWHPLRDSVIIQPLTASPHARDVGRLGRAELQRLLGGSSAERDVLGLLTAAMGGLSGLDLQELSGIPLWEIEEILHTTAGRTFARRPSRWDPATRPEVYLLGHEELQAAAISYLADSLAGYRDRLHAWAEAYRAQSWPPDTPEYLLSGYYQLLEELRDLPRMTVCALDAARHDRMLDMTGGDAAALIEVRAALDAIAVQEEPDLANALALARHRDRLADRNAHIPVRLPTVWVTLGQLIRAQALAISITDPVSQARALAQVAGALAEAGQYQQAEAAARSITDPVSQATALAQVAKALARAGETRFASRVAAATCVVGEWATAAGPVLLLMPTAFTILDRMLEEQ